MAADRPRGLGPLIALFALTAVLPCAAQEAQADGKVRLAYSETDAYRLVERSDLARYDNGKYTGHVFREVRGSLSGGAGGEYRGTFYVLEETLRDLRAAASAIDDIYRAAFRVLPDGSFVPIKDEGFPSLRGFPAFPAEPVAVGDKWTARFARAVDPRNEGCPAVLPLIAEFEYRGEESYKGIPVRRIFAKYATRYRGGTAGRSAPPFAEATGTHDVDILVHAETGRTVLIRDRLDETFKYPDGSTVRFRGFTLAFTEGSLGAARGELIAALRGGQGAGEAPRRADPAPAGAAAGKGADGGSGAGGSPAGEPGGAIAAVGGIAGGGASTGGAAAPDEEPAPDESPAVVKAGPETPRRPEAPFELAAAADGKPTGITVEETDAGVKLTVSDLRFAADSDALLPAERERLEILARALRSIQGRTFLVEGHTAAVGRAAGELELSKRRAKKIVDELSSRGIPADRFIYKGWGGTKPVAGNDTEEGRARNRRVEITVLD